MHTVELENRQYGLIKGLWEKLNRLHGELSTHFKDHFATFTFDTRLAQFCEKEHKAIFTVMKDGLCVAYVMVSIDHGTGEIDSIFVDEQFRGKGLGASLMEKALSWLDDHACRTIRVSVAEGNEPAMGFYRNFGFFERFTVLQRKPVIKSSGGHK